MLHPRRQNREVDEVAMVAKTPVTPKSRWLKDVLELKEKQDENMISPRSIRRRKDREAETVLRVDLDEETRDGPPTLQSDSIEEKLQERVKSLKKKVSKTKTKSNSKRDPTLKVCTPKNHTRSPAHTPKSTRSSTPSRKKVDKLSISTKECVLKAMYQRDPPITDPPQTRAVDAFSPLTMPVRAQTTTAVSRRRNSFGKNSKIAIPVLSPLTTKSVNAEIDLVEKSTKSQKKEKKMSWLRKALVSMDHPKQFGEGLVTPRTVAPAVPAFEDISYKPIDTVTSPLQLQLWLSEFRKAQQEAHVAEELFLAESATPSVPSSPLATATSPRALQDAIPQARACSSKTLGPAPLNYTPKSLRSARVRSPRTPESRRKLSPSKRVAALEEELASPRSPLVDDESPLQLTKYYFDQGEAAILMDYSTFEDDAESVSSIDVLFNWLTCREPDRNMRIDHRGKLVMASDSVISDSMTWHEPKTTRRKR